MRESQERRDNHPSPLNCLRLFHRRSTSDGPTKTGSFTPRPHKDTTPGQGSSQRREGREENERSRKELEDTRGYQAHIRVTDMAFSPGFDLVEEVVPPLADLLQRALDLGLLGLVAG
ncbi:hypothetical protein EYF80_040935 [Liparis tanakae]|uniref:Uncharacterized protein n=1 Tax=Liparis tanakae TaxID=230148 RepID=A0A4Z2G5Q6_9TELE|nr:hypothetical protein EYF80_040935 [Liparis tanakae]